MLELHFCARTAADTEPATNPPSETTLAQDAAVFSALGRLFLDHITIVSDYQQTRQRTSVHASADAAAFTDLLFSMQPADPAAASVTE
jgi:hypothetical protein